jgi:GLPGLI family protein
MKKVKLLCLFVLLFTVFAATAQRTVNDASFRYDISIESASGATVSKAFEGAFLQVFIKGSLSRTEMTTTQGIESAIHDTKTGKGTILKEYSGQKLMITLTKEDWLHKNQLFQALKFSLEPEEKIINGFSTKKAAAIQPNGESFIVYYAPDIILGNKQYGNSFPGLAGLPVQYEVKSGDLKFVYTLKNISYDIVTATKFEIPKSGFRIMTYDENQQLKKREN